MTSSPKKNKEDSQNNESPMNHYIRGLSYYVEWDYDGNFDNYKKSKALKQIKIARDEGLENAKSLLEKKSRHFYILFEAAKYCTGWHKKQARDVVHMRARSSSVPREIQDKYFDELGIVPYQERLQSANAEEYYRTGLLMYIGDVANFIRTNPNMSQLTLDEFRELAFRFLNDACKKYGSEKAAFLLKTKHQDLYAWLEAAKYGNKKAIRKVRQLEKKGEFKKKISKKTLERYFNEIGIPFHDDGDPTEHYKKGLEYYIGDNTGKPNQEKAWEEFKIAKRGGSKQAATILNRKNPVPLIYLEAAKYGSQTAKEKVITYDQNGLFDGEISPNVLSKYFTELEITSVLGDNPDEHYKKGLEYYIGYNTGKPDRKKALEHFKIAKRGKHNGAKLLLETEHQELYVWLEAAKSGNETAKETVAEYDRAKIFDGKIPDDILVSYFNEIGVESHLTNPEIQYKEGLAYYVGDKNGREDIIQGLYHLQFAAKLGSAEAKSLLEKESQKYYIYLEAAKYGSERAKDRIISWNLDKILCEKIPKDLLQQYFLEIGITSSTSENPDELYKMGLLYATGDVEGGINQSKAEECFLDSEKAGSKDAEYILKLLYTNHSKYTHYVWIEAARYGSEKAKKRVIELNNAGYLKGRIPEKKLQEYFSAIGITEVSQAIPNEQKKSLAKDAVTKKDTAKPAPKEKQPKSTPKKPKKQEKIVIDKERLQEVKAEHLYIQNRLAIDYGDDEPSVIPVSVPLTPETPAKAEAGSEWEQMRRALSKTHIQIISALLEEPGNITKQHDIAKSEGTMLDILYDEINEISDEILGDLLIDEGELVEEYIEDVKSLCQ